MGFWSTLGTIGGLVAAPFTGGASMIPTAMGIGGAIGGVGDALSGAGQVAGTDAAASAQGRLQQGQIQQGQDRNAMTLYQLGLNNAINTPSALAHQAAAGDLLSNLQDVNISGLPSYINVPNISGGLRPSALGPNSKAAANLLTRRALTNLMDGNSAGKFNLPTMPTLTPLPEPSGYDTFSKTLGRVGAFAGVLGPVLGKIFKSNSDGGSAWSWGTEE